MLDHNVLLAVREQAGKLGSFLVPRVKCLHLGDVRVELLQDVDVLGLRDVLPAGPIAEHRLRHKLKVGLHRSARLRHLHHDLVARLVLLVDKAERLRGAIERSGEGEGSRKGRGASPLLGIHLGPAEAIDADVLPDSALEPYVVGFD